MSCLSLFALCGALLSQSSTASMSAAERLKEAKNYFHAGKQAYSAGSYLDAAEAFEQAFDLAAKPAIVFSIGQSYRLQYSLDGKVTHLRLSVEAYRKYLSLAPLGARRQDALEHLSVLQPQLLLLGGKEDKSTKQPKNTKFMVSSRTEGAEVSIDGSSFSPVPLIKQVTEGAHQVVVRARGFADAYINAKAVAGHLVVVPVDLQPLPGHLTISAPEGAEIVIDGLLVGHAPLGRPLELPAGDHFVVVSDIGHKPFSRSVTLARGQALGMVVKLETTTQRELSHYVLGGAAISFLSTVALGAVAIGHEGRARWLVLQRDSVKRNLTVEERDDYISSRSRSSDFYAGAAVGMVATALLGSLGGMMYFLDEPTNPQLDKGSSIGIAPTIDANGGGVVFSTRF